jgi:hypothetical protein
MASGTGNVDRGYFLRANISQGQQDPANNRTYCYAWIDLNATSSYFFNWIGEGNFQINGTVVQYFGGRYYMPGFNSAIRIGYWEGWVGHNGLGQGSITAYAYFNIPRGAWYTPRGLSVSYGEGLRDYSRPPNKPSNPSLSRNRNSITMSTSASVPSGAPGVGYYRWYYRTATSGWLHLSDNKASWTWAGADPRTTYWFYAQAYSSEGFGPGSNESGIHGVPFNVETPTLARSSTTAGLITVNWNRPSSSVTIDTYHIYRSNPDGTSLTYLGATLGDSSPRTFDAYVPTRQDYRFYVYARNAYGWSDFPGGNPSAVITSPGVPSVPQSISINSKVGKTITVSCGVSANGYGSNITSYRLQLSTDNGATWKSWNNETRSFGSNNTYNSTISLTNRTFTYELLTPALTYIFRAYAVNSIGDGDKTNPTLPVYVSAGGARKVENGGFLSSTIAKRYDSQRPIDQQWVNIGFAKRYDETQDPPWVDLL